MKTALVLSAGGMFGAWQAGAWKVLSEHVRPDLVVGASIGSLNGWAIAGGCPPDELARYWLELSVAGKLRLRLPHSPLQGCVDARGMEERIRDLYRTFHPQCDYALVATDLLRLKPKIFLNQEVTSEHLLASCAVPGIFDQRRISGRIYTDGGILAALPLWAAVQLGATEVLALHAMPYLPAPVFRLAGKAIRRVARFRVPSIPGTAVVQLEPSTALGGLREMIIWRREAVAAWIERGQQDAAAWVAQKNVSIEKCFE